jgi:hypothetical protein
VQRGDGKLIRCQAGLAAATNLVDHGGPDLLFGETGDTNLAVHLKAA